MEAMLPTEPRRTEIRGAEREGSRTGTRDEIDPAVLTRLIERIAQGEPDALGELYDLTVGKLFALAQLILRNNADAEEVVCDVYTQAWQSAARYRGERGGVMAWLLIICRSRALDLLRRNRVRARPASLEAQDHEDVMDTELGPDDILDLMQQGTIVHQALQKLTPVRRRLISLAFFRGLSHFEIAEECQLPVGTVKSHIRRALILLREELEGGMRNAAPTA
jgi:RNA polymerase sigma-70 factor, ECF subfamily